MLPSELDYELYELTRDEFRRTAGCFASLESIEYQSDMEKRELTEGWWSVKWPEQDSYTLVEFVRIGQESGRDDWGYRKKESENPIPISTRVKPGAQLDAAPAHVIKNMEQLIEETRNFGDTAFYRGHSRFGWELTPSVFRKSCKGDERSMLNDFRNRAPVRDANSPEQYDLCRWLTLAQHYGLPTRALDWTLSPLVAAYFATAIDGVNDECAGAVWVLNAIKLNKMTTERRGLLCFSMDNKEVEKLVKPAFDDEYSSSPKVIAVMPIEYDKRQFVQQSAFTIHADGTPLQQWRARLMPEQTEHRQLMQCAVLPVDTKAEIRSDLERLGIHEASLFPDLAHLARYVARDKRNWKS